jgi:(2Fe-2S) ferredoxin
MSENKQFFGQHLFICMNQRDDGRECCAERGAHAAQKHLKARVKELGLSRSGEVRVNQAGCLGRCEEGPVIVIYPQGTWYTYVDNEDLDEIIDVHLVGGKVVERLKI